MTDKAVRSLGTVTVTRVVPDTTPILVCAANVRRLNVVIRNVGTVDVYLGTTSSVLSSTGYPVLTTDGPFFDDDGKSAWYAYAASPGDIAVIETSEIVA